MYCEKCGNRISPQDGFCGSCGARNEAAETDKTEVIQPSGDVPLVSEIPPDINKPPEPGKSKGLLIAFCCVGAVLVISLAVLVVLILGNMKKEEEVPVVPVETESDSRETETEEATEEQTEEETAIQVEEETEEPFVAEVDIIDDIVNVDGLVQVTDRAIDGAPYGFYIRDLVNEVEYATDRAGDTFEASALINVPILFTVAALADEGQLSLNDTITFRYETDGRGNIKSNRNGENIAIDTLLKEMLQYSDNNATNSMINYLGFDTINNTCHFHGFDSIQVTAKIVPGKTKGNLVSAKDIGDMLEMLYTNEFSSLGRDYLKSNFMITDSIARGGIGKHITGESLFLNHNGVNDIRFNEVVIVAGDDFEYIMVGLSDNGKQDTLLNAFGAAGEYVYKAFKER